MQPFNKTKSQHGKKRVFLFLSAIAISTTPLLLISSSYKINKNSINGLTSNNLTFDDEKLSYSTSKKIIKRSFHPVVSVAKDELGQIVKNIDTSYQIRINLKYKNKSKVSNIDEDVKHYSSTNEQFYKLISSNLKDVISYKASRLFPFIWIVFANRNKRKENLKFLASKSFVKSIVSYDEPKELDLKPANIDTVSLEKFSKDTLIEKFRKINFTTQRKKEDERINSSNYKDSIGAIGIIELGAGIVEEGLDPFKDKQVEIFKRFGQNANAHSNLVAAIAAGKTGVDRFAKIYSAGVWTSEGLDWHDKIEWMVVDKHVRVINHSYGTGSKVDNQEYLENSYILDYLARKYGVINVFAAGNGQANPSKDNEWIDGIQLAFNGVTVGSANNQSSFRASEFSNWTKDEKYKELPKPLVLAPGEEFFIDGIGLKDKNNHGTSFAAPLVSGLISVLLREQNDRINVDVRRTQAILAILAASSNIPDDITEEVQVNGLYRTLGTGMVDYEKMYQAANNLYLRSIDSTQTEYIFEGLPTELKKGDTLQVSLAWLFNAGILARNEETSKGLITNEIDEDDPKYKNSSWLTFNEAISRQNQLLFSDYDIYIEHEATKNNCGTVYRTRATKSNVELARYIAHEDGNYRFRIHKYKDAAFANSIPDEIAISFTINKAN